MTSLLARSRNRAKIWQVSYSMLVHLQPSWWTLLVPPKSEICGSHCVVVEDSSFLGCDAMSVEKCLPTFRSIVALNNCWRWTRVHPSNCRKLSTNNSMSDSRGLQSYSTETLVSIYTNNRRNKPDDRNINTNIYRCKNLSSMGILRHMIPTCTR